jgi:hypothetical protein
MLIKKRIPEDAMPQKNVEALRQTVADVGGVRAVMAEIPGCTYHWLHQRLTGQTYLLRDEYDAVVKAVAKVKKRQPK